MASDLYKKGDAYRYVTRIVEDIINDGYRDRESQVDDYDFYGSSLNVLRDDIVTHESTISDAHNIQEIVLDIINDQLLFNGGLESTEKDNSGNDVPTGWRLVLANNAESKIISDTSSKRYGTKSLKFILNNDMQIDNSLVAIAQDISSSKFLKGNRHTLSYYYRDDGSDSYDHYVSVWYYNSMGTFLGRDEFMPEKHFDTEFTRFYSSFTPPPTTSKVSLLIGVRLKSDCLGKSIWIDYPMINTGDIALNPPELTAEIIDSDFIKANAIEAKHIKADEAIIDKLFAGEIDTSKLRITSSDGTLVIEDNTLKIKSGKEEGAIDLIVLGNLPDGVYGLRINDSLGNPKIEATGDKIKLTGVEIDDTTYVKNQDGTTTYLSQIKKNKEGISLKVDRVDFEDLEGVVSAHSSEIEQTAGKISNTVESLSLSGNIATLVGNYDGSYAGVSITPLSVDLKREDTIHIVDKSTGLLYNCIISSDVAKGSTYIPFSASVQIGAIEGSGIHLAQKDFASRIDQTASQIRQEVQDVQAGLSSEINQTATSIRQEVQDVEQGLQSSIDQQAGEISTITSRVNVAEESLSNHTTQIQQNADAINLRATKEELGAVDGRVDRAFSDITTTNARIANTVANISSVGQIAKLNSSYSGSVSSISVLDLSIPLKAGDKIYVVNKVDATIVMLTVKSDVPAGATTIPLSVSTLLNADVGSGVHLAVDVLTTRIDQQADSIEIASQKISATEQGLIDQQAILDLHSDQIASKVDNTEFNNLKGTVTSQGTLIQQNADNIALKADKSIVDDLSGTVAQQGTLIQQNADSIALKASQSDLDTLTGRVGSAESNIDVQSGRISSLVSSFSSANSVALLSASHSGIKTSLAVKNLAINIKNGDKIYLIHRDKGIKVDVIASGDVNAGATSIPIKSFTFPEAFPVDSGVYISSQSTSSKIDQQAEEIGLSVKAEKDGVIVANPKLKISAQNGGYILLDAREVISTGTIKSEHIATEGLGAEVIKTGIITITDSLTLKSGNIHINKDGLWAGNSFEDAMFKIDANTGKITANSGEIGGFILGATTLTSSNGKLELDSALARFTLSHDSNYKTYIQPEGVLGTVPLMVVDNYDPYNFSNRYYVSNVVIRDDVNTYKNGVDFLASPNGEITRFRSSNMPLEGLTVEYKVIDDGIITDYIDIDKSFVVQDRSAAIITEDSLLNANYINNLIVGSQQVGVASITDAHIVDLNADKIDAGVLNVSKGIEIKTDYGLSLNKDEFIVPSSMVIKFEGKEKTLEDISKESLKYAQALIIDNENTTLFHFDKNLTATNGVYPIEYDYVDLVNGKFGNSLRLLSSVNTRISYHFPLGLEWSVFTYLMHKKQSDPSKILIFTIGDLGVFRLTNGSFQLRALGGSSATVNRFDTDYAWYGLLLSYRDEKLELSIFSKNKMETIHIDSSVSGDKIFFGSKEGYISSDMLLDELRLMNYYVSPDEAEIWHTVNQPFQDPSPVMTVPLPNIGIVEDVSDIDDVEIDDYYYLIGQQISDDVPNNI